MFSDIVQHNKWSTQFTWFCDKRGDSDSYIIVVIYCMNGVTIILLYRGVLDFRYSSPVLLRTYAVNCTTRSQEVPIQRNNLMPPDFGPSPPKMYRFPRLRTAVLLCQYFVYSVYACIVPISIDYLWSVHYIWMSCYLLIYQLDFIITITNIVIFLAVVTYHYHVDVYIDLHYVSN